jgi:lysozyme family protein
MDTARRALQYAAGVATDGRVGPLTIAAVKAAALNDILLRFKARPRTTKHEPARDRTGVDPGQRATSRAIS